MFRKMMGTAAVLGGLFALGGCVIDGSESGANAAVETQTELYIDLDNTKDGALGMIFGMPPIDDRLDYAGGDREDWRYIIVTETGNMSIKINIDAAGTLEGGWNLIDSEGRTLHRETFIKSQNYYEPSPFPVQRGVYYFQIYAAAGKSVYTLGANFTPTQIIAQVPDEAYQPMEEVEEEAPAEESKKQSRSGGRRSSQGSSGSSGSSESSPAPKPEPVEEKTGTRFVGDITIMTEQSDGSYEVTVRGGKNKGVETGAVGTIEGTSIKIEMTQCFNTSCRALIPAKANPKSLKKGAKVIFML